VTEDKPVFIHADELVVQLENEAQLRRIAEVPLMFDTSNGVVVLLLDLRKYGGPLLTFGLQSTTSYAVAMALLQMRARVRRGAEQPSPSPRS
jgi:hypothetical protein